MSENQQWNASAYEQQESKLSAQSTAFLNLLTKRGILADTEIRDDKIRQAQKDKITGILYGRWSVSHPPLRKNWNALWAIWTRCWIMWTLS